MIQFLFWWSYENIFAGFFFEGGEVSMKGGYPSLREELSAWNLGITIIGVYYALEFGSFQYLYPFLCAKLPMLTAIAGLIYAFWILFSGQLKKSAFVAFYLLFCSYMMLNSYVLTSSPENREVFLKLIATYMAYFVISTTVFGKFSALILIIDILLAFMAFSCLTGFLQGGLVWGNTWLGDENIYAVFCCTGIPFAYVLLLRCKVKWKKLCYIICLFLFTVGVIQAASRGGFLSFLFIVFMFWQFSRKKIKVVMFSIILGLVILTVLPPNIIQEIENINVDEQKGESGERAYLWHLSINMFQDNKIFGIGMGNYGDMFLKYDQLNEARDRFGGINWRGQKMVAHSTPLTFLAETGLLGVSLLSFMLIMMLKQFYELKIWHQDSLLRDLSRASLISLTSFGIGSIFLTLTVYPFFYSC